MTEELDEYPSAFQESDPLPWEPDFESLAICPFSNMRSFGQPLQSLTSNQLLRIREEAVRRNGRGTYFTKLVCEIDELLLARGGL